MYAKRMLEARVFSIKLGTVFSIASRQPLSPQGNTASQEILHAYSPPREVGGSASSTSCWMWPGDVGLIQFELRHLTPPGRILRPDHQRCLSTSGRMNSCGLGLPAGHEHLMSRKGIDISHALDPGLGEVRIGVANWPQTVS
jgi:hypothetical protein